MLQMMAKRQIGRRVFHFTVEGTNFYETVAEYDRLSWPDVLACGLCGSDNLDLTSRVAQGKYKYTSVKCLACKADLTFGKNKDDDQSFFLRRKENGELDWRAFEPKQV